MPLIVSRRAQAFVAVVLLSVCSTTGFQSRNAKHWKSSHAKGMSNEEITRKISVFLVAVVTSPASFRERRGWLRNQWQKNMESLHKYAAQQNKSAPVVILKFAIGVEDDKDDALREVLKEEKDFGDMLLLHNIQDLEIDYTFMHPHWPWRNVSATTEKVLYSIQWAVAHFDFQYFARIGDDAYFRPDEFYKQASNGEYPTKMALIGQMIGPLPYPVAGLEATVVYPQGAGYLFTHDVATFISRSADILNVGFPEDANVGAWLAGTKIDFFDAKGLIHDCNAGSSFYRQGSPKDILVHQLRSKEDWERIDHLGEIKC